MQVQINKPVTLGSTTYGKGQHAIPAEDAQGWFFDALVKDGTVVVLRADEPEQKANAEAQGEAKAGRKSRKNTEASPEDVSTAEGE